MKTALQRAFEKWLEENGAQVAVAVVTPLGDRVRVENFLPAGWGAVVYVVAKVEDGANRPN